MAAITAPRANDAMCVLLRTSASSLLPTSHPSKTAASRRLNRQHVASLNAKLCSPADVFDAAIRASQRVASQRAGNPPANP